MIMSLSFDSCDRDRDREARSVVKYKWREFDQRSENPKSAIAIKWQLDTMKQLCVQEYWRSNCLSPFVIPDRQRSTLSPHLLMRAPKSGWKIGATQKLSKSVECFDDFQRFCLHEDCREVSRFVLTLFDDFFDVAPFCVR